MTSIYINLALAIAGGILLGIILGIILRNTFFIFMRRWRQYRIKCQPPAPKKEPETIEVRITTIGLEQFQADMNCIEEQLTRIAKLSEVIGIELPEQGEENDQQA